MLEDDSYLFAYLDKDIEDSKKDIKDGKGLSQKGATAMLLKGMYNHIAHLDQNMVTKAEFNGLKGQFNGLKDQFGGLKDQFSGLKGQFEFVKWIIISGFAFLAVLQAVIAFVK